MPSKVSAAIARAETASEKIKSFKDKATVACENNEEFIKQMAPTTEKLGHLVNDIRRLEATKEYLETLQSVDIVRQVAVELFYRIIL